jgi:hypothetical protein
MKNNQVAIIKNFKAKARITGVSVSKGNGEIPITSIAVNGSINALPKISMTIYPNNGTVTLSAEDLIKLAKSCQSKLNEGVSDGTPNVNITISMDSQGLASTDNYELQAILSGVELHMDTNSQSIYVSITATSPDTLISNIDLSIYESYSTLTDAIQSELKSGNTYGMPFWAKTYWASIGYKPITTGTPIASIIKGMIDITMQKWKLPEDLSDTQKAVMTSIHKNNQKYIGRLGDFLSNSFDSSHLMCDESIPECDATTKAILSGIEQALYCGGVNPLYAMMNYLASDFGVWYAPCLIGNMQGKLSNQPFLMKSPDKTIDLNLSAMNIEIHQDQSRPPVGQICMTSTTLNTAASVSNKTNTSCFNSVWACYPEKSKGGIIYNQRGPTWLVTQNGTFGDVTNRNNDRDPKKNSQQYQKKSEEAAKLGDDAAMKLLNILAQKEYYRAVYQYSLLMVNSIIDPGVSTDSQGLGDFFTVKQAGTTIGKAVMSNVNHIFNPNNLTTQIGFTMLQL